MTIVVAGAAREGEVEEMFVLSVGELKQACAVTLCELSTADIIGTECQE